MNGEKYGDKFCVICREWIGNYITGETPEGTASYYSIIKRKYCANCKPWKRQHDFRFYSHEYRKRKKEQQKEQEKRISMLIIENKTLRQLLMETREELEHLKRW